MTHTVVELEEQIIQVIAEVNTNLENITDALIQINYALKELVIKLTLSLFAI